MAFRSYVSWRTLCAQQMKRKDSAVDVCGSWWVDWTDEGDHFRVRPLSTGQIPALGLQNSRLATKSGRRLKANVRKLLGT
jgi:hypothetical protein